MLEPAAGRRRVGPAKPLSPLVARAAIDLLHRAARPLTAADIADALRDKGVDCSTRALDRGLRASRLVETVPGARKVRFRVRTQVPPQRLPVSRPAPYRAPVTRDLWPSHAQAAAVALFDTAVDAVVVGVRDAANLTILFEIRMDRVLAGVPKVAVAMPLAGLGLAEAVALGGFDCWPWPWQARLGQRSSLGPDAPISAAAPALGVACEPSPQQAWGRVRDLLQNRLGIADASRVRVEAMHCDDAEGMRRIRALEGIPRRRSHGGGSRRAPVVSSCDRCGQPLSDPYSVAIGVGPECQRYYDQTMLQRIRKHPEVEPRSWIGVKDQRAWLTEIRAALVHA